MMDRQSLLEELTIQEVILESLEGSTFEGAEEERREAREEIRNIKRTLKALAAAARMSDDFDGDEDEEAGDDVGDVDVRRSRGLPSSWAHAPPARDRPSSAALPPPLITTPRKQPMELEGWESPAALTLRGRKRDFTSTNLQPRDAGSSKSRRTTPTPGGGGGHLDGASRLSQSPWDDHDGVEIIDLTSNDVDDDSTLVAEQIKQELRHNQERNDRQIAMRLSTLNSSLATATATATGSTPAQPSAFSRLMAAQRPKNPPPVPSDSESDQDIDLSIHDFSVASANWPTSGSRPPLPNLVLSQRHQLVGHSSAQQPPDYTNHFAVPGAYSLDSTPGAFGGVANSLHGSSPLSSGHATAYDAFSSPLSGMPPVLQSHGGGSLSDIINRTSMFDYTNGVDALGNPLPRHLMDYVHDTLHDPRVSEKELDDLLQNIRPDMEIPEMNRDGTPEGLKQPLYPHQALALTWMKKMEEGTNKGGILADDMGLGKTISTLALMLSRPATSRPKTNLIIGPLALIRQWEEEIMKKTKPSHRLCVFVYHNKKTTTEDLLRYDVVLTTYGTIAQELKRLDKFTMENMDRSIDFNDKTAAVKFPLLNPTKAYFYRVILDEAQCIKNKDTQTAKACHKLRSKFRWCLTGTPMMNSILELYSLVHFLQIKPYCHWNKFSQGFGVLFGRNGDPKSVAMTRLRALLKAIMLRRKKDSKLDGKPILRLPEKSEEVVYAELTGDERDFYNQLEKKSQVQFSKYLRDGSIGKNYSSILVLLLRLRQACCHPHLNLDVEDAAPLSTDEMMGLVKSLDASIVARIKGLRDFECPICYDAVQSPSFLIPCGHDSCQQCLTRLVDSATEANIRSGNESDRTRCPVCRGGFDPKKCFTYEAFQKVHMPESIKSPEGADDDDDDDDDDSNGEEDLDDFESDDEVDTKGNLKGFIVDDEFASDDESERKRKKRNRMGKRKKAEVKPSMLKSLRQQGAKNREAYKKYMRYLRKTWLPAAKVSECMRLLQEIYPTGEKTIIFSQWTLLLDLLEVAMWHEKYEGKLRRYDGGMSSDKRFSAAQDFRDDKNVKVMLVSLRAGNAGLNLTAASRVIIMDPFWNPYIEMQAVDRAYRIGQQREVKVYRILTKETVEDRIVELQNRKKELVEAALDEAESVKIGRLNVNELKFLFNTRN